MLLLPVIMYNCALKTPLYSHFALPWQCDIMNIRLYITKIKKNQGNLMTSSIMQFNAKKKIAAEVNISHKVNIQRTIDCKELLNNIFKLKNSILLRILVHISLISANQRFGTFAVFDVCQQIIYLTCKRTLKSKHKKNKH